MPSLPSEELVLTLALRYIEASLPTLTDLSIFSIVFYGYCGSSQPLVPTWQELSASGSQILSLINSTRPRLFYDPEILCHFSG